MKQVLVAYHGYDYDSNIIDIEPKIDLKRRDADNSL